MKALTKVIEMTFWLGVLLLAPFNGSLSAQTRQPTKVVVGGVSLHYVELGAGEPIILLHGGQGDYRAWQPQMEALVPRYRVISYSRRYHYPNVNAFQGDYSALIDADDLGGFLAALKLPRVNLIGTSYGAFTALALALKRPELVRSMVLAEPPIQKWALDTVRGTALYRERVDTVYEPARKAFAEGKEEAAVRIFIDAFDGSGSFDGLSAERRTALMQNAPFFKALTSSADAFPNLSKDAVRLLRIPVLVIKGANTDEFHRVITEELASLLPMAKMVTISRAGHGSPRQNPREFNEAVIRFLTELGTAVR